MRQASRPRYFSLRLRAFALKEFGLNKKAAFVAKGRCWLLAISTPLTGLFGRGGGLCFLGLGRIVHFKTEVAEFFHFRAIDAGKNVAAGPHKLADGVNQVVPALGELFQFLAQLVNLALNVVGFLDLRRGGFPVEHGERRVFAQLGVLAFNGRSEVNKVTRIGCVTAQ